MAKIKIYNTGKAKEPWLIAALAEYEKRLPFPIEWKLYKDDESLYAAAAKLSSFIALDPNGQSMTSEDFALFFETHSPRHILIGGATGLPAPIKAQASHLISLSPLTFTHQMTRLILLEQIYRATQILKNSSYHKI
ncbi:MAG: 23S rRNA (pseudouridine(1915)-N(3))-methyltransferase RlmH [Chlamydiia bacterium]|nr:23S rRNA (pseudouridine(1915)-N(3))-methyltransferase RlmH [Chlamydiia bacterium]MCP5491735.1 23S rRNA (pseudouridine(1915)-N(3))-methyltransferase RlmH [Chlamydiales bacterium]